MKHRKVPREKLNRSIVASFNIEGLNPSEKSIRLAESVIDGKITKDEAIARICSKYAARKNVL